MFGRNKPPAAAEMREQMQTRQAAQAENHARNLEEWFEQNLAPWLDAAIQLYTRGAEASSDTFTGFESADLRHRYTVGFWNVWMDDSSSHAWPAIAISAQDQGDYQLLRHWAQDRYGSAGYSLRLYAGSRAFHYPWSGDFTDLSTGYYAPEDLVITVRPD
jgi:hypothetical protein